MGVRENTAGQHARSGAIRTASGVHLRTAHGHGVQFYENEAFFVARVSKYLVEGITARDRVIAVVTADHRAQLTASIEAALAREIAPGEIQFVDAHAMLEKFMVDDRPDAARFDVALDTLLVPEGGNARPLRLFGEMVDLLTRAGSVDAACELEELWNAAASRHSFELLCAYWLDGFHSGHANAFARVCANHDRVWPTEKFENQVDTDLDRRAIATLQQRAAGLEREIAYRREIEERLRVSVERERAARVVAEASDAFKEEFLAMLGHDLRNPLNTVLTTVRLMLMEEGTDDEKHQRRLKRVVASGVRMQRMIAQLLDVTHARLSNGIPVERVPCDVASLATSIVEEARGASPDRTILFSSNGACPALLDADRIAQVISNLIGNAVTYGDPEKPIEVSVQGDKDRIEISVHNFGAPIDGAIFPTLFEPFTRRSAASARSEGLGLGLYITDQIVRAHGGSVRASSVAGQGTRFVVELPCT